jgi:hypothetical protein
MRDTADKELDLLVARRDPSSEDRRGQATTKREKIEREDLMKEIDLIADLIRLGLCKRRTSNGYERQLKHSPS